MEFLVPLSLVLTFVFAVICSKNYAYYNMYKNSQKLKIESSNAKNLALACGCSIIPFASIIIGAALMAMNLFTALMVTISYLFILSIIIFYEKHLGKIIFIYLLVGVIVCVLNVCTTQTISTSIVEEDYYIIGTPQIVTTGRFNEINYHFYIKDKDGNVQEVMSTKYIVDVQLLEEGKEPYCRVKKEVKVYLAPMQSDKPIVEEKVLTYTLYM